VGGQRLRAIESRHNNIEVMIMRTLSPSIRGAIAGGCAMLLAQGASALDILLTNDDGWDKPGILTVRDALCNAGHNVTLVGPAGNQSGRGGSFNTGAFSSSSAMALTKHASDDCGDVYSLAAPVVPGRFGGTPVDSLKAGLQVVLADNPPDLIVSGNNEGQNLGKPTSNGSGTVGAALQGAFEGIPAIAGSVGVVISENSVGYPSTEAAYEPAAEFLVRLIDELHARFGAQMFPKKVRLLNVNFPVPYEQIKGVKLTNLADRSEIELPLYDRSEGFAPFPPAATPSCATLDVGASCSVGVAFQQFNGQDAVTDADTTAHMAGYISVTPMDGDMTATTGTGSLVGLLKRVKP
jgi:5'-nucleotidase